MTLAEGFPKFKTAKLKSTPKAARRRSAQADYVRSQNIVLKRSGGKCEARFSTECEGRASQTHHVVPRSRAMDNSPENLLAVCRACHELIHAMPSLARARGLLLHARAS